MRKTKYVTIADAGRDKGKRFFLTEMPASRAEKWGTRAMLSLAQSGVPVPPNIMTMGIAGLMMFGLEALLQLKAADADGLMAEMIDCIQVCPDPTRPEYTQAMLDNGDSHIEEVKTRMLLRDEVFELHTGFSAAAYVREQAAKEMIAENMPTT